MKQSKVALVRSIVALLLCASMFVGTTFAWFTDSVVSQKNQIMAGTLDVTLEYLNEAGEWVDVQDSTTIFDEDALWEPGHTEVVYLRMANKGSLALRYHLGVNIVRETGALNQSGKQFKLSDYIHFGVVEDVNTRYETRAEAQNAVQESKLISEGFSQTGNILVKGAEQYVALVVYMPEEVGNEANYAKDQNPPKIELGINLVATQYSNEEDSFGSDYDANATFPEFPDINLNLAATANVSVTESGAVAEAVSLASADESISAYVPEGVQLQEGVTALTFSIKQLNDSEAEITLGENEITRSVDVHIEGIAEDNTVPMTITIRQMMPAGLNIGNYTFYHVEDGQTNVMTLVDVPSAHNEFSYDAATGDVTMMLTSFSEIATVADTVNAWNGTVAGAFAGGTGEENDPYLIANADQLAYLNEVVSEDNANYGAKHYKLIADVNLGGEENANNGKVWYPIGYHKVGGEIATVDLDDAPEVLYVTDFVPTGNVVVTNAVATMADDETVNWYTYGGSFQGTFDGNGHKISNIYQNTWLMKGNYDGNYWNAAMGLFGYVNGGTVKNLTVDNFSSDGEFTPTGVIAAYAANATFENIAITNCNPRVYNTGNGGIVGIGGNSSDMSDKKLTFTNITIDNSNKISALWGSWDVACGGLMGMFRGNGLVNFTNCHVAAQIDVYNDVCGNYQYYWYRYSGMMIGSIRKHTTDENGYTVPDTSGIIASGCTVHFGDWNDYYYCELVANSLASYTHDHQFSRLTEIASLDEIKSGDNWIKAGNYLLISGDTRICYHIVNDNGTLKQHLHTEAGEETVNGETVLKEDKQIVYLPFNQIFQGYGWGVKNIPVYNGEAYAFEGITILDREEANSVVKFEKADAALDSFKTGTTVTIGELFKAAIIADGKLAIKPETVQVTVSPVGEGSTAGGVYTADISDWTQGKLKFSGAGVATITITDYYFCTPTTINITIEPVDKFVVAFDHDANTEGNQNYVDKYLYRVGNQNTVELGSLFEAIDGVEIGNVTAKVTPLDSAMVSGTYTADADDWTEGTIQFCGTGPVKVTIYDDAYANEEVLYLEIVDAYNRTTASFSGNSVLLNDVFASSTLSASGVIYGNGFTVNMENAPISEKNGAVFHLYDGTILKNLNIVGDEFTTVSMNVNDTNYGVSAVRAWGTVVIENCYISGCRSAVSVTGTELTIKDSVIANGSYANIDFRSGILNLHNVTTINEPHTVDGTTVVGLGIVGNMTASAGRQLNITGSLNQYNWVSQEDCANIKASGVDSIFNSVFTEDKYADLRYNYNGTTYVNAAILSLCNDFGEAAVTGCPSNYNGMAVTATISSVSVDGYVWAPAQQGSLTDADMKYHDEVYTHSSDENAQGTAYVPPSFDFTNTTLEVENEVVQIRYESGSSYTLTNDTLKAILTAEKYGVTLPYSISMNGIDYTNQDIVFSETGSRTYTIVYTITDGLVYGKDGKLTSKTFEITKELKVFATVVDKSADAPTFTFYYGTNGSASEGTPHTTQPTSTYTSTIKQVGENYYIMPNVSATSENAIGSQTIDSETIYYPIVDGINVRSGNASDYDFTRYYPIFKAVKISDNGTEYSYETTTEMPDTIAWVSADIDSGNGASSLNDGFGLYNSQYLCKIQKKAGDAEAGGTSVVKYSYTALDGKTYYYYVGYRFYDESEGCVTPDTLITLADGSQVRVDSLTGNEELLVWNLETGTYDTASIVFVDSDEEMEYEIIHLYFSDGSDVKVISEHGFFDIDLGKYVYIDALNYADYVGHRFIAEGNTSKNTWKEVTLDRVVIEKEVTTAWSPVTVEHLCYYTNGVLSMPGGIEGLFNIFEVDTDTMRYDAQQKQNDIEEYGLFTLEDFGGLITEDAFKAFNGAYLKVAIGKGMLTWEDIAYLAERYIPLMK